MQCFLRYIIIDFIHTVSEYSSEVLHMERGIGLWSVKLVSFQEMGSDLRS